MLRVVKSFELAASHLRITDLLPVAAEQPTIWRALGVANAELPDQAVGGALRAALVEQAAREQFSQRGHHQIVAHRPQQGEALALALRD